jgi:hypothetical protein
MSVGDWVPIIDVTPARQFGEIITIMPPGYFYTDEISCKKLRDSLIDFSDRDYLLPMGDPVLMITAAAMLGARGKAFKMLKWDRKTGAYFDYTVSV